MKFSTFVLQQKSCYRDLNSGPLPYQGSALPLSYNSRLRAENGAQTRDPQLGRLVLYQLSYFRKNKKKNGGQRWIRTTEGVSQQIYSLPHLATLELALKFSLQTLFLRNCSHSGFVLSPKRLQSYLLNSNCKIFGAFFLISALFFLVLCQLSLQSIDTKVHSFLKSVASFLGKKFAVR